MTAYNGSFLDLDYTDIPFCLYPSANAQLNDSRFNFLSFLMRHGYLAKNIGLTLGGKNAK